MNWGLLLALCVSLLGCTQATESSNPECADLYTLQKNLANTVKRIPGNNHVNCKPNKNCTGLICDGNVAGKSFHGTVELEGCHKPVRMIVNMNNRRIYVKNGFYKKVKTRIATIHITANLEKKNGVVHVTVKTRFCALTKFCIPYTILKDQKIRVRCNGSWPTMLPSEYPLPPSREARNPECKGLNNTKRQVEHHFGLISKIAPGSKTKPKISCKPARNCSDLQCSGVANDDHFNATATIDYCSDPVTLRLKIDVPNKKIHIDHRLKDGEKYRIISLPPIYIKVNLKRVRNTIYFTASIPFFLWAPYYLVKNMSITVDPSHCPGYHGLTTLSPQEGWKCKKMTTVAKTIEQKLSSKRKDSSLMVTDCQVTEKCSGLHCSGKQGRKRFYFSSSVNSCTSTPTLDFTLLGKRKFNFKNGMNQLNGKPLLVQMKKTEGVVVMNVSLDGQSVLQNAEIPYDPHDCSASAKSSVPFLGFAQATESSNPECTDLYTLQKNLANTVKLIPGNSVNCKPNENCSGLICNGNVGGKSFHGTIELEGCHEPVRMIINMNNRHLYVKNGSHKVVKTGLSTIHITTNLEKKNGVVHVTVKTKVCAGSSTLCLPHTLLKDQKIRVQCNGSWPTMLPSRYPLPASRGLTTISPQEIWKCEKMTTVAKMVEQKLSPKRNDSSLMVTDCHVVRKCSELHCSGKKGKKEFSFNASVNSCTSTPTLDFTLLGKHKFNFKNGKSQLNRKPLLVQMKKTEGVVVMNVSWDEHSVLQNAEIPYDPHDCSASAKSSGLSRGAIVGVVVGVIIFFVVLIAIIVWIVRGQRRKVARYNDLAMSDDSDPLFLNSEPAIA